MYCPNPECPNLLETGAAAEFRDGIYQCSDCGGELEYGAPPAAASPSEADDEEGQGEGLLLVATYDSPQAAHTALGALESEGVTAFLQDEHSTGVVPGASAAFGGVKLMAPASEAERAAEIIRDSAFSQPDVGYEEAAFYDEEAVEPAPSSAAAGEWRWILPAILLAALAYGLWSGGSGQGRVGHRYSHAGASRFAVVHLPHTLDHLDKSDIELILELDLEYLETQAKAADGGGVDPRELDPAAEAPFINERARERGHGFSRADILGVLELRSRYLERGKSD